MFIVSNGHNVQPSSVGAAWDGRVRPSDTHVRPHAAPTGLRWGCGWAAGYKHGAPNGALPDARPPNNSDTQIACKVRAIGRGSRESSFWSLELGASLGFGCWSLDVHTGLLVLRFL